MLMSAATLAAGTVHGPLLRLDAPLSLWGGVDVRSGTIIDETHPQRGATVKGRILAMPGGRGSSSSSSALVECVRLGTAPLAIILTRHDPILLIGALVAEDLYGVRLPLIVIGEHDWANLSDGEELEIDAREDRASIQKAQ
jgi:predicted aconitase with swiveling domain